MPYRVLVVDDSSLMRQLLTEILSSDPELEVVGTACDPFVAREKIKALNPDVLTLDIEMPRMDGLTFLEKLMRGHPMPVVMISSLTERGAETTLRALSLGAVDYVSKPKLDVSKGTIEQTSEMIAKVKAAARVKVRGVTTPVTGPVELGAGCPSRLPTRWVLSAPPRVAPRRSRIYSARCPPTFPAWSWCSICRRRSPGHFRSA